MSHELSLPLSPAVVLQGRDDILLPDFWLPQLESDTMLDARVRDMHLLNTVAMQAAYPFSRRLLLDPSQPTAYSDPHVI